MHASVKWFKGNNWDQTGICFIAQLFNRFFFKLFIARATGNKTWVSIESRTTLTQIMFHYFPSPALALNISTCNSYNVGYLSSI